MVRFAPETFFVLMSQWILQRAISDLTRQLRWCAAQNCVIRQMRTVAGPDLGMPAERCVTLATAGGDSFVRIYDIPGRRSLRAFAIEANEPHTVAFSPDGTRLAALGADNRLYVWRVRGDMFERYAVLVAIPNRAAVAEADRRQERARWLTSVGNDSVALATETSAITIVGLDPAGRLATPYARAAHRGGVRRGLDRSENTADCIVRVRLAFDQMTHRSHCPYCSRAAVQPRHS